MLHVFTLFENVAIMSILSLWIRNEKIKRLIYITTITFVIIWIISKFTIEDFQQFDNWTSSLNCSILTVFSAYLVFELVVSSNQYIWNNYRFWILIGILFYYAVILVMFALSNQFVEWNIESIANIISKISISWGLILSCRR